jgi:hypothetical protein
MKLSICTATVTLAFLFLAPIAGATSLIHSTAYPRNAKIAHLFGVTYHIGLNVKGENLSQLSILVPNNTPGKIRINRGIKVTDQAGQEIEATSSFDGKQIMINFAQPVSSGTTVEVDLQGVRTSDLLGRTWLFPVYGRSANSTQNIPFGTARLQTSN